MIMLLLHGPSCVVYDVFNDPLSSVEMSVSKWWIRIDVEEIHSNPTSGTTVAYVW